MNLVKFGSHGLCEPCAFVNFEVLLTYWQRSVPSFLIMVATVSVLIGGSCG